MTRLFATFAVLAPFVGAPLAALGAALVWAVPAAVVYYVWRAHA